MNRLPSRGQPIEDLPSEQPRSGSISERARAAAAPGPNYLAGLNPEQRAGRRDDGRPAARARGRRHRQDAGADDAHRPPRRHRQGAPLRHPRRHLHQQGGAGDEGARRCRSSAPSARACRGSAPSTPSAPRFFAVTPSLSGLRSDFTILGIDDQIRLLKQVIEAENIDEKRWPARQLAGVIDGWKNRGLAPEHVPAGEAGAFAFGKGGKLYTAYQEAPENPQRRRFRRPAARMPAAVAREPGRAAPVSEPFPVHAGRRIPGHQRRPVSLAAAAGADAQKPLLRRRRRPVDLRLARRRGRQHLAVRERLSRRDGDPPRAQLPLDRPHPRRGLGADRQ